MRSRPSDKSRPASRPEQDKRVYGLGPTLEANYEAQTPSASPTWVLKKVRIYVSGPDGVIGTREFDSTSATTAAGNEKALVYHHDHLGSIVGITPFGSTATAFAADTAGKSGRFSEDAWGQRRDPLDWVGAPTTATDDGGPDSLTPRGFTGHEMLDDLGLVHMNGRIYDPLLGRFLSADIVVQAPASLQAFNRYSYVYNNPLSLTDPSGFFSGGSLGAMSPQPLATGLKASGYTSDQVEANLALKQGIDAQAGAYTGSAFLIGASMVPFVGEIMDLIGCIADPENRYAYMATSSANIPVGGLAPNAAAARASERLSRVVESHLDDAARALTHANVQRLDDRLKAGAINTKHLDDIENLAKNSDEFKRLQWDSAVGKNRPGEAEAAIEAQGHLGRMERSNSGSADFVITDGANKGKTVDLMFSVDSKQSVERMNANFGKNWDKTAASISSHISKADITVLDFRNLSAANQATVTTYLKDNFNEDQLKKIKILMNKQ